MVAWKFCLKLTPPITMLIIHADWRHLFVTLLNSKGFMRFWWNFTLVFQFFWKRFEITINICGTLHDSPEIMVKLSTSLFLRLSIFHQLKLLPIRALGNWGWMKKSFHHLSVASLVQVSTISWPLLISAWDILNGKLCKGLTF